MIKTIILLVIVFYTFPCRKINAQSRDTSNIFAGYYIAVYNKSDLSHKKIRRHHKHSYNTAIDSRYRTYFIPIKIGKNNINQENIWKEVTDNKTESDTIFIFPDSTDIKLFKQIGLIDSNISDKKHLLLQEIKSLPYYNTASNKAYLFKCLYVKGTFLQLRIDTIDKNWQDYLLDIYSISTKKKKKLLLVTGIDSLHSIKSDGTSIQARPYIKTGQQKPCTALIVGNWFAGEEGYIRKEALLEQGEPFVSWIRCNDCPQIRFNESNSGSVVYPGPPVSWNDPSNTDDPQAGYGYIPNDTTKEETFFYHSDHLGSTSYITDDHANITQYDAYLPYGELLVDEHSSSEELPYKFNGKQFDEETGLYYYGARYMNPMASIWYGVDPLAEKYVSTGCFVYCIDNPVRLVDPDGKKIWIGTGSNSSTTLDLIRGTLPEKERSFVQLDVNGYIDQKILLSGLNKNSSNNLKDLVTVVQDRRVIKYFGLATSINMLYDENNSGNFKVQNIAFNPPTHGSELGSAIKDALANDKTLNVKELRDVYKRQGLDESYSVTGNLGFTLRPNNEQGNYPNNSERALSSFIEVYTSAVGTTKLDQYANAGHELYNHVLFYLMGRDPTHNNKDLNRHEEGTLNDIYKYNPILLRNDKNKFE